MQERGMPKLTEKRKRIMAYFIEATQKLIRTEGIDGLSIRKIAAEAGYNSATIYHYFHDLEHLALFGSVCYLREYILELSRTLTEQMNSFERYCTIYRCFNRVAIDEAEIYHTLFFGRYRHMLGEVLRVYYGELFPEELQGLDDNMKKMLMSGTMLERDRVTMENMVKEGFVAPEKAEITLELVIAAHQNFLYEAYTQGEALNREAHLGKFEQQMLYLLKAAK